MTIIPMGARAGLFGQGKNKPRVVLPAGLNCASGQTFRDQEPVTGLLPGQHALYHHPIEAPEPSPLLVMAELQNVPPVLREKGMDSLGDRGTSL